MFVNQIYKNAHEAPDSIAVVNNGKAVTYAEFACAIESVRNELMKADLPNRGVIVRLDRNLYLDWVILLAVRTLGITVTSAPSWQYVEHLDIPDLAGIVYFSVEEPTIAAVRTTRPALKFIVLPLTLISPADMSQLPALLPESHFGDQIVYTSGTTGAFKKIVREGDRIEASFAEHDSGLIEKQLHAGDFLHCMRFETWSGPGSWYPALCWYRGATAIFDQRADWAEHFNDYPVSFSFVIPAALGVFGTILSSRPSDYPSLKLQIGGGFVDGETVVGMIEKLDVEFYVAYAGTEFGVAALNAVHSKEDLMWLEPTFKPEMDIVGDDGQVVPSGTEGNIRIRTVSTSPVEYLDEPELNATHFRDGYFYPGDLALSREDGRIRILGRVQDALNVGGRKLAVAPIEESIRQALGLENVCVFAVQEDGGRETVAVVLEARHLPERTRLEAVIRQVIRSPRLRVSKLSQFPRGDNEMMKINRRKVLELARKTWRIERASHQPERRRSSRTEADETSGVP